jgi:hypothetical protein
MPRPHEFRRPIYPAPTPFAYRRLLIVGELPLWGPLPTLAGRLILSMHRNRPRPQRAAWRARRAFLRSPVY